MSDENDCDGLEIGSFYFMSVNLWPVALSAEGLYQKSEDRHGQVAIFGFDDIPGGLDLYLTDRAWSATNNAFVANNVEGEGIVRYTTPPGGITAGIAFGMGNNTLLQDRGGLDWVDIDFNTTRGRDTYFELGEDGDQIFLYCKGGDGRDRPFAAFSYGNAFLRDAEYYTIYGTNTSSAPEYFFVEPSPNSTITTSTPGLLDMRPPEDCNGYVYWFWEFQDPCFFGNNCITNFFDLRNAMSDPSNYVGENPDGTFCRASAFSASVLPTMVGLMVLSWVLVMF